MIAFFRFPNWTAVRSRSPALLEAHGNAGGSDAYLRFARNSSSFWMRGSSAPRYSMSTARRESRRRGRLVPPESDLAVAKQRLFAGVVVECTRRVQELRRRRGENWMRGVFRVGPRSSLQGSSCCAELGVSKCLRVARRELRSQLEHVLELVAAGSSGLMLSVHTLHRVPTCQWLHRGRSLQRLPPRTQRGDALLSGGPSLAHPGGRVLAGRDRI